MRENKLIEMETFFLALSDKTRLRLLNLMRGGEIPVGCFTEALGESQPKISRHLAYLRNAGIVSARRDGKWINYKIQIPEDESAARILEDTLEWLETQTEMRREFEGLARIHAATEVSATLARVTSADAYAEAYMNCQPREELEIYLL